MSYCTYHNLLSVRKRVTHITSPVNFSTFMKKIYSVWCGKVCYCCFFLHAFYLRDRCVPYTASNPTTKPPNNPCKYFWWFYAAKHFSGKKHLSATQALMYTAMAKFSVQIVLISFILITFYTGNHVIWLLYHILCAHAFSMSLKYLPALNNFQITHDPTCNSRGLHDVSCLRYPFPPRVQCTIISILAK